MRIPIRELEIARENPSLYASRLASGAPSEPRKRGYFMYWRDAVLGWHSNGLSPQQARDGLAKALESALKSESRREVTLDRFDAYVATYLSSGLANVRTRMDVVVPVPEEYKGSLVVSGQVPRFDRTADFRYVACYLSSGASIPRSDLRMPVTVLATADKLNLDPADVSAATYCFATGEYIEYVYSPAELNDAYNQVLTLLPVMQLPAASD